VDLRGGLQMNSALWIAIGATFLCAFIVFIATNKNNKKK
jgi:hypothetical protein